MYIHITDAYMCSQHLTAVALHGEAVLHFFALNIQRCIRDVLYVKCRTAKYGSTNVKYTYIKLCSSSILQKNASVKATEAETSRLLIPLMNEALKNPINTTLPTLQFNTTFSRSRQINANNF